jgi:hypothetical protein
MSISLLFIEIYTIKLKVKEIYLASAWCLIFPNDYNEIRQLDLLYFLV